VFEEWSGQCEEDDRGQSIAASRDFWARPHCALEISVDFKSVQRAIASVFVQTLK